MTEAVEVMCMYCGVSLYLKDPSALKYKIDGDVKVVQHQFCTQCGGELMLIGNAGDEPNYRLNKNECHQ